ncbi:MAG: TRAP transporter substrate-binding protein [Magnetovibrio sp.]|nr:TRAP transporter substrate-binding protein [Magnetovibrio sp.]
MNFKSKLLGAVVATVLTTGSAYAAQTSLTFATHHSPEGPSGELMGAFLKDIEAMSNGEIKTTAFYSSSLVKSQDTFDAAANGVVDCDMTNGSYQTGKNPAFQFVADVMGGYDTPLQYLTWVNYGGGAEIIDSLYAEYGMKFVGSWVGGQESLTSSRPLNGVSDLKGFKFRSPPGMESEIFASLGAKPVVMDFTEIFSALETKVIDGADASSLANNVGLGLYDIVKYTTFPGFHSMSSDHMACNRTVWDALPANHQAIIETAMQKLSLQLMMKTIVANGEAVAKLSSQGVTLHNWSGEDRATFRAAAKSAWGNWAKKTPETAKIVESHKTFLARIGLGG